MLIATRGNTLASVSAISSIAAIWSTVHPSRAHDAMVRRRPGHGHREDRAAVHSGALSELKTDNARRRISLPQEVRKEVKLWKLRCPYSTEALVFPSREGSPPDASNFHHRVWRPLLKAAKRPHGRFHALRHSFASALITDNQSPKLVQTLLGHHGAAFTMDVYSDLWPTALAGIGERIGATLFSGDGSKVVAATPSEGADRPKPEAQVLDFDGGPCRDRTYDQLIKSQLLYQLS